MSDFQSRFEPAQTETWWKAIDRELRGSPRTAVMVDLESEPSEPPFHAWDRPRPTEPLFEARYWGVSAQIAGAPEQLNQLCLKALNRGADHLLLCLMPGDSLSKTLDGVQIELLRNTLMVEGDPRPKAREWIELCQSRGLDARELRAAINFDPFEFELRTGKKMFERAKEIEISRALSTHEGFDRSLSINTSFAAERGASPSYQLALALASAQETIRRTDRFEPSRFWFGFSVGRDFVMEIAKLRAFRALSTHFSREHQVEHRPAYVYCEPALRYWSGTDPHGNLIRSTVQALSAILGGADEISSASHRMIDAPPSEDHLGFQMLHLLRYEAQLNQSGDLCAGAYTIEALTERLAAEAWDEFCSIERNGGLEKAIEKGSISERIKSDGAREELDFAEGKLEIIGSNVYPHLEAGIDRERLEQIIHRFPHRLASEAERRIFEPQTPDKP